VTEDTTAEPMPQGEACEFRANLVTSTHLEDAFRIIRPDTRIHPLPARRRAIADQPHPPLEADVHCCASSMATQDGLHIIGGCAWFGETDAQNITLQLPPNECFSKTTGILGAMLLLLQSVEPEVHLRIHLNDDNILRNLTKQFGYNEDLDWFHVQDGNLYRALAAKLKSRSAHTSLVMWQKNKSSTQQEGALTLAKSSLNNPQPQELNLEVDPAFLLRGQRLSAGSQCSFYKNLVLLHTQKYYVPKASLTSNIVAAQQSIRLLLDITPSPPQLWKSIHSRDIPKNIRNFLWKCLHNKYKIGPYWNHIPNFEDRGICQLCGNTESMEHILVECPNSTIRKMVWGLASELWRKREVSWLEISFGSILGANLPNGINARGTWKKGQSRLFAILVLESAHLIWKLRCEWTIENQGDQLKLPTENEIHNRWVKTMNMRLKFDKLQSDTKRYGSRAIRADLVLKTWSGVLLNEDNLPDNWIWESGVLVGITPRRPPGQGR